jgi:hypothetical protein
MGNLNLIFSIKSLNLLQNLERIVLYGLLQSSLNNLFIYHVDDEVKVFFDLGLLRLNYLLFFVVLVHCLVVLFLCFLLLL